MADISYWGQLVVHQDLVYVHFNKPEVLIKIQLIAQQSFIHKQLKASLSRPHIPLCILIVHKPYVSIWLAAQTHSLSLDP